MNCELLWDNLNAKPELNEAQEGGHMYYPSLVIVKNSLLAIALVLVRGRFFQIQARIPSSVVATVDTITGPGFENGGEFQNIYPGLSAHVFMLHSSIYIHYLAV